MTSKNVTSKSLIGAVFCGVLVSLATGIIENPPEASILGAAYYGFPLVWRVTMITMPSQTNFMLTNLALDTMIWVIVSIVALIILIRLSKRFITKSSMPRPLDKT